ncbi:MAG: SIR2 family protein [Candidatus Saelkia tenebricola]|nr:SIR2 family protein [Candidatus Saelkia tenebricola]
MLTRTLYILGAGFSKTFGLPLTNEFLAMLVEDGTNEMFFSKIDNACRNFYPSFRTSLQNYPNVEDFYNYYCSLINYYDLLNVPANKYVLDFIQEFNFEVSGFLENKTKNIKPDEEAYIYEFCNMLDYGDAVITFNWDNVLETYLEKSKKKYKFTFDITPSKNEIPVLKLHGSIDWFSVGNLPPDKSLYQLILQYNDGGRTNFLIRVLDKEFANLLRREGNIAFFIPPTLYKDEMFKPIDKLWANAYFLLRNSLNKFFIGYSLSKEDTMARVLFSSYHFFANAEEDNRLDDKEQIIVINSGEGMDLHYRKYCWEEISFLCATFKRFIDVRNKKIDLQREFRPYMEELLKYESDKFIQQIAEMVFSSGLNIAINQFEENRLREFVRENFDKNTEVQDNEK